MINAGVWVRDQVEETNIHTTPSFLEAHKGKIATISVLAFFAIGLGVGGGLLLFHFKLNALIGWSMIGAGSASALAAMIVAVAICVRHNKKVQEHEFENRVSDHLPVGAEVTLSRAAQENSMNVIDAEEFKQFCAYRTGAGPDKACAYATHTSFFHGNCDEVNDLGWGCAWRCIQTCASSLGKFPSFMQLYDTYRLDPKSTKEWAEPGYGKRYLDDQGIPSQLALYNKDRGTSKTPEEQCEKIKGFPALRDRLIAHFQKYGTPVMIDDVSYAMTIVGIRVNAAGETILFMADPHKRNRESGLYSVVVNSEGQQIATTGIDDGRNGLKTAALAHFNKGWMLLFPQPKHD